jgi:hypothetical protein
MNRSDVRRLKRETTAPLTPQSSILDPPTFQLTFGDEAFKLAHGKESR